MRGGGSGGVDWMGGDGGDSVGCGSGSDGDGGGGGVGGGGVDGSIGGVGGNDGRDTVIVEGSSRMLSSQSCCAERSVRYAGRMTTVAATFGKMEHTKMTLGSFVSCTS